MWKNISGNLLIRIAEQSTGNMGSNNICKTYQISPQIFFQVTQETCQYKHFNLLLMNGAQDALPDIFVGKVHCFDIQNF